MVTGTDQTPCVTCSTGGNSCACQASRCATPVTVTDGTAARAGAPGLPVMRSSSGSGVAAPHHNTDDFRLAIEGGRGTEAAMGRAWWWPGVVVAGRGGGRTW